MSVSSNLRNPLLILPSDPAFNRNFQQLMDRAGFSYEQPENVAAGILIDNRGQIPTMDVYHLPETEARKRLQNSEAELAVFFKDDMGNPVTGKEPNPLLALPFSAPVAYTITARHQYRHTMTRLEDVDDTMRIGTSCPAFLQAALKQKGLQPHAIYTDLNNYVDDVQKGRDLDAIFHRAANKLSAPSQTVRSFVLDVNVANITLNVGTLLATPAIETESGARLAEAFMARLIAASTEVRPLRTKLEMPAPVAMPVQIVIAPPQQDVKPPQNRFPWIPRFLRPQI